MDSTVVITTYEEKKHILKNLSHENKLLNLKFYTFEEIKKNLFFDYGNDTILYVMEKYHKNLSIAKTYIENLYFLKDSKKSKIQFLNELKKDLENKKLLKHDHNFCDYLKNKKIIVYGYSKLSKEQEKILSGFSYELKNELKKEYSPKVYEAKNIEEEVEFIAFKISELLNKISINKIKVIANKEYKNAIHKYFKFYNLPFNESSSSSFYSTITAKEFLNNYDNLSIEANILSLSEKYQNVNDLVSIINKSAGINDKGKRKEFIINDLKKAKVANNRYDNAILLSSIEEEFSEDDHVFLLGFNMGTYPKIYQDNDFLCDEEKEELGLDTSTMKNKLETMKVLNKFKHIPNLVITYKVNSERGKCYPSSLLSHFNTKEEIRMPINKSYSKISTKLKYAKLLDSLYKYNSYDDTLEIYNYNLDIPYKEYRNKYTKIDSKDLIKHLNNELTLSYTSLESYNECAFKFYISKILHLDIYEENFKTIIGLIVHHILEIGLKKEINISEEIINFIKEKEYTLNKKEFFYLEKISEELELVLETLKEHENLCSLKKYLFETDFYVYKDKNNLKITFKGFMDKIMYQTFNGKEVVAVVDYKTGDKKIDLDMLEYGLDLQLPIYLYLLKKSDRFKNAIIAGFYLEHIIFGTPNIVVGKTLKEQKKEALKLYGYTNKNENILKLMDESFEDSSMIKGLRQTKSGDFDKKAKLLTEEEMNDIVKITEQKINESIEKILACEFTINPKVINNKNKSCKYCKFKDICFTEKADEVILGGETNELDKEPA